MKPVHPTTWSWNLPGVMKEFVKFSLVGIDREACVSHNLELEPVFFLPGVMKEFVKFSLVGIDREACVSHNLELEPVLSVYSNRQDFNRNLNFNFTFI